MAHLYKTGSVQILYVLIGLLVVIMATVKLVKRDVTVMKASVGMIVHSILVRNHFLEH